MFRFRLQTVLELKEAAEKERAAVLGRARDRADIARGEQEKLVDALAQNVARLHSESGEQSVGALRSRSENVARLEARVATAAEQLAAAENEVEACDEAFRAAFRDRRVLDRLKERYGALWRLAMAKGELSEMDSVALARFTATPREKETDA